MKRLISMLIAGCFFLNAAILYAQTEPLKPVKSEILKAEALSSKFERLNRADEEIIALSNDLRKKGFQVQKGDKNFWGFQETYEKEDKTVTFSVYFQDYTKPNSKDVAATGQVRVVDGDRSEIYSFSLEAPGGAFDKAIEHRVDKKLGILKANSWWSCVRSRLLKASVACASSLITCAPSAPTWAGYLACVAAKCGITYTKVAACCACDCRWTCKWAVGCCDR